MKKLQILKRKKLASAIAMVAGATVLSVASLAWAAPTIDVNLSGGSMSVFTASDSTLYVRIAGPNDYFKELRGEDAKQWYPDADAPDGLYRYDSYSSPKEEKVEGAMEGTKEGKAKQKGSQKSGSFTLESGMIVEPQPQQDNNDLQEQEQSSAQPKGFLEKMLISALDTIIPSANAADLTASSTVPRVNFNDNSYSTGTLSYLSGNRWNASGTDADGVPYTTNDAYFVLKDTFGVAPNRNDHDVIRIKSKPDNDGNKDSIVVEANGAMRLADGAVNIGAPSFADSLLVYSSGNVALADRSVYIQRDAPTDTIAVFSTGLVRLGGQAVVIDGGATTGAIAVDADNNVDLGNSAVFVDKANQRLGVGLTTPSVDLHVKGTNGTIRQDNNYADYFEHYADDDYVLRFSNNGGSTTNVMTVENDNSACGGAGGAEIAPCVGFFKAGNPEASVHIKKDDGHTRLLVEEGSATTAVRSLIKMKNNGAVGFEMEDTTQGTWQFRSSSSGAFIMNKLGNTGSELTVFDNGNATFKGTVRANGVLLTSSRASKTDFSAIKPNEVMQKLAKMNVEEWRYKEADKNDRHISPMAEDFYSLFKLGADNTGINPNDLASVAIIAAKELQKKVAITEAENAKLQKRLASLEKLVTNLASSNEHLKSSGAKVALK